MNLGRVLAGRLALARHTILGGRSSRDRRGRSSAFLLVLMTLMGVLSYAGFATLFGTLAGYGAGAREITSALALALTATLLSMLLFDLDGAIGTLLLDRDLELLRRAPLTPAALVALKLFDALPRTIGPLLVVALPALIAYTRLPGTPAFAALLIPPALLAMWAIPLGLGVAASAPLLRVIPARRAREVLGFLATISLTGVWLANALFVPRLGDLGPEPMVAVIGFLGSASARLTASPGLWIAKLFEALRAGEGALAGGLAIAVAAAAALAAVLAIASARALTRTLDSLSARGDRRLARRAGAPRTGNAPRGLVEATIVRDARLFTREWTVLGDVLVATLLWTLLPLASGALFQANGAWLVRGMLTTLAIGLGYEISARSIPFERGGIAWVRIAPVRAGHWVLAKLVSAAMFSGAIVVCVSAALAVFTGLGLEGWAQALAWALPALLLSIALGLWAGASFGDFRWTNPRRMLTLAGRLVASGLMLLQVLLWFGAGLLARESPRSGLIWWSAVLLAGLAGSTSAALASRKVSKGQYR